MIRLLAAGCVASLVLACGGPNNPGEMPPMAPRPDPVQPIPGTGGGGGGGGAPVPGAPDPLAPKGTPDGSPVTMMLELPGVELASLEVPLQQKPITVKDKANPDAGVGTGDASAPLPAPTDGPIPTDASRSVP